MTLTGILLWECELCAGRYGGRQAGTILRRPGHASWDASWRSRRGRRRAGLVEPRPAAPGQNEPAVAIIMHEIVGDRVFPGAIERAGAAPRGADLGVAARPAID